MTESKASAIQGWVRTIWPILATVIALAMGYQSLSDRMTDVEEAQREMCETINVLRADQNTMNADIVALKALMEVVSDNTTWMRNNWEMR